MTNEDQIFIGFISLCVVAPLVLAGLGVILHVKGIIALVDFLLNFMSSLSEPYDSHGIFNFDENNRVSLRQRLLVGGFLILVGILAGWFFLGAI